MATQVLPPPSERYGLVRWLRRNLFGSWRDAILTLVGMYIIAALVVPTVQWAVTEARWPVVVANTKLISTGLYPAEQTWRVFVGAIVLALLCGLSWGVWLKHLYVVGLAILAFFPLLAFLPNGVQALPYLAGISIAGALGYLAASRFARAGRQAVKWGWIVFLPISVWLVGGFGWALTNVPSNLWGGLLLTLILTAFGVVLSFPIGVALALGRRSDLPVIKYFSIAYIEVIRGVPLITVLFMAQLVLPLFLPEQFQIDRVVRATVGIALFSAAYLAENIRGGLQNIPRGQFEAADALGLNALQRNRFIILPQAIRMVVPILAGQFIGLFKDTSLVAIVGLLDLTGIANTVLAQPQFIGTQREVYLFIALIYWIISFVMSGISRRLEFPQTFKR